MILLDTSPLVALCDARDGKHRTAVAHLAALAAQDFAVCDAVLTETCDHLPHRHQRQRLRTLLEELDVHALPMTYERAFWVDVFEWLEKNADRDPEWADGCLAVLCGRDKRLKIWTYDRQFRTTWRRPNGTALPLAFK